MRCYDGCPDSDLQKVLDDREKAMKRLRSLNPNVHCTYFPVEQKYHIWNTKDYSTLAWHSDRLVAIETAINVVSKLLEAPCG